MSQSRRIPAFLHNNGLLLACLGLFAVFFVGMVVSGLLRRIRTRAARRRTSTHRGRSAKAV